MTVDRLEQAMAGAFGFLDSETWFASRIRNPLGLATLDRDTALPALIFQDGGDEAGAIQAELRQLDARATVWLAVKQAPETAAQLAPLLREARARMVKALFAAYAVSPLRGTLIEDIRYDGSGDPIPDPDGQPMVVQSFDLTIRISEGETDPYLPPLP